MFINRKDLQIQTGYKRLETFSDPQDTEQGIRFLTNLGYFELSYYAPSIIRLRAGEEPKNDYGMLVAPPEAVSTRFTETDQGYRIAGNNTALEITSTPGRFTLYQEDRALLASVTDRAFLGNLRWMPIGYKEGSWMLSLALSSETQVYGLGEKFASLNRKGQLISSWNLDATTLNAEPSYKNTPFAWSPDGWGILAHTTGLVKHAVGYPQWSHRSYILEIKDTALDIFLFVGDTPAEILAQYTHLTGRAPEPPRWSYGAWMSRAYYKTAEEAMEVATTLRERKIPSDVLVLDGRAWHEMETRFDFQWDASRYPDPQKFVADLDEMDFHVCLWEYPYLSTRNPLFNKLAQKGFLLKDSSGEPYVHSWLPYPFDGLYPHLMPSGIIDMTNPDAYAWYRDEHKQLFDIGISVMKTDYGESIPKDVVAHNGATGEELHNVYAMLYNRCAYEAAQMHSEKGALVWGRAGWIGSQRYPIQWGGDPQCDWEALAASIRGGLSWGMSGSPFYSHDIGGFSRGNPDPELYIRWTQAGIMCSHTRFHGWGYREPWFYGEEAETITRKWLNWRYRLIPYLQACALEANRTGMPVMRAMPLAFPNHKPAWAFEQQYMLGGTLLVVPVLRPGGKTSYYLPPGRWHNIWTGKVLEGAAMFEEVVSLDHIPVFARSGTLLPLGPAVQSTRSLAPTLDLEELWVFDQPQEGIALPGLSLAVDTTTGEIKNLPAGIRIHKFPKKENLYEKK